MRIDGEIPAALDGERLDRVVSMLDGCSRSAAAQLIANGAVALDGKVTKQRSLRASAGMRISFDGHVEAIPEMLPDAQVEFDVMHADEHLVIINKPAGLVVHPGAGRPDGTLANGLLARFPEIADVGEPDRPGIVHRLDGETSGLLAVARTTDAYDELVAMMAAHEVERIYAAVVTGSVVDDRGIIDAPIGRSGARRTRMAVTADGRVARTHYEVLSRSVLPEHTFLRCQLETGRTHQIRVHLAAIGHTVVGDRTYGPSAGHDSIDRVALHAHRLGIEHPITGEYLEFEAPLPADFVALLNTLGLDVETD